MKHEFPKPPHTTDDSVRRGKGEVEILAICGHDNMLGSGWKLARVDDNTVCQGELFIGAFFH